MNQLEQTEFESFRALFDRIPIGIFRTSLKGELIEVNTAFCQMFGYPDRESVLKVKSTSIFADLSTRKNLIKQLNVDGIVQNREILSKRRDGSVFWVEMDARVIKDKNNNLSFFEGAVRDITRRKELEARMQRWSREMEALLNVTSALRLAIVPREMAFILVDRIYEILGANSVSLFLIDNQDLLVNGVRGASERLIDHRYPLKENFPLAQVITHGNHLELTETSVSKQMANCSLYQDVMAQMVYGVLVPLKTTQDVVGLLHLGFSERHEPLSEDEWHLLLAIAEISGNALNRVLLMETLEQRVIERTRHLSAICDVTAVVSDRLGLPVMLERLLEKVLEVMRTDKALIHMMDVENKVINLAVQQGLALEVVDQIRNIPLSGAVLTWLTEGPEAVVAKKPMDDKRIPGNFNCFGNIPYIGVPIRASGQVLGLLSVLGSNRQDFSLEDVYLLVSIGDQIGVVIENARLHELDETTAVMEERQRLARELHDSVTQSLYSISLMAKAARKLAADQKWERANHYLNELGITAQQALKEMRLLIYELRPSALENENLWSALNNRLQVVEQRSGIEVHLYAEQFIELPHHVEEALYRIAIEGLNNVLKHAQASVVSITISPENEQISLTIIDDGKGFDTRDLEHQAGVGIKSMRERVEQLNGSFDINSKPGSGTTVRVQIPLEK